MFQKMSEKISMLVVLAVLFVVAQPLAFAQTPPAGGNVKAPCAQIEKDCKKNGYIAGQAGQGKGLWWDCMCPLIAQGFPEPSKNVLTVPSDQSLVPSCRQHPHGQKIMARCADMLAKKNAKNGGSATP